MRQAETSWLSESYRSPCSLSTIKTTARGGFRAVGWNSVFRTTAKTTAAAAAAQKWGALIARVPNIRLPSTSPPYRGETEREKGKRRKRGRKSAATLRVQSSRDTRIHTRHTHAHIRTYTPPALLFIPRNSRKEKADSIEPPTCTKGGPTYNFPPIRGCRPPATGCTHIRIQSSRAPRTPRSFSFFISLSLPPSLSLPFFLSLSFFSLSFCLSPPYPSPPAVANSMTLYSLFYLFLLARERNARAVL